MITKEQRQHLSVASVLFHFNKAPYFVFHFTKDVLMGQLLQATCLCGYQSDELTQGFGFSFFRSGAYFEVCYCDRCGLTEDRDARSIPFCESCQNEMQFYRLQADGENEVQGLGLPVTTNLHQKQYWHCPRCKQEHLSFEKTGVWD